MGEINTTSIAILVALIVLLYFLIVAYIYVRKKIALEEKFKRKGNILF
jgi:uncharacterized membrane protein (DUF485 family)